MIARRHIGVVLLAAPGLIVVGGALLGPWLVDEQAVRSQGRPFLPAQASLPLGSDHLGRDVLAVLLDSGTAIVLLPVLATAISTVIGTALGMMAGWRGGRTSGIALRAGEFVLVVPPLLTALVVLNAFTDHTTAALIVLLALLGMPATMRFTRAATSTVVGTGYVEHATAIGERAPVLLVREVLPSITAPVLADAGLRLVGAFYLASSVSFLGFGGSALAESWATMVAENAVGAPLNPWALAAPACCIVLLAVSVNLVADRLADRFRRSL